MSNIDKIKLSKENLQKEITKEMMGLVDKFKEYVSADHPENPKYIMVEGVCSKINYGIVKDEYPNIPLQLFENKVDDNYYCYLPNKIYFLNQYKIWCSDLIFYNNKLNCWLVYNNGNEKFSLYTTTLKDIEYNKVKEFTSLDIETQIKFLEHLQNFFENDIFSININR